MPEWSLLPLDSPLTESLQHRIDQKTKPVGALGTLEALALKIGQVQNTLHPTLRRPAFLVFAGDHGIVESGVSPYPQEVTAQMVLNFLAGGAAINVFCRQHQIDLQVIDAGVKSPLPDHPALVRRKVCAGTRNFLQEPALTSEELQTALRHGQELAQEAIRQGSNVLGFGEMGIGNTSAAAALMQRLTDLPLEDCVGRGTGLDDSGLSHKQRVLAEALERHANVQEPLKVLQTFGGAEIAMMTGAMLETAQQQQLILLDGFIATAAFLVAFRMHPEVRDYVICCHQSDEQGHQRMLEFLNLTPLLRLNMRLGEGTGAAVAFPILQSAALFLNEMASFESAGVSSRHDA